MRPSRLLILSASLVLAALGAALAVISRGGEDSLERARTTGVLRIGYAIEAPYALIAPGGRVTGESPETARRIAARLGVRDIEWVQLPFEALIPDLREGRIDLVAAGLFITRERARLVRFSDPTVCVRPALLVLRGNPAKLASFEALQPPSSARIAVVDGSVEKNRLQVRGWRDEDLIIAPDAQSARAALAEGVADAVALSAPTLRWMARSSAGAYDVIVEQSEHTRRGDCVGFAFGPKGDALQHEWNRAQAEFIGSAEHLQTIAPFGFEPSNLPRNRNAGGELRK